MRENGIALNDFNYSTILTASVASMPLQIHAQVIKTNYQCTPIVGTALHFRHLTRSFSALNKLFLYSK
jgi:hypothetical protein